MKDEDWIEAIGSAACTDCRFFEPEGDGGAIGQCRRFPPKPEPDQCGTFPHVNTHDWCGEFELTPSARRAFEAERLERWNGRLK